ncbi:Ctr-domain-containing protein [Exidia glandulosa HHB12029]|uniref:Copper transport protein n=1 Tax=Exidia glandulosa HHB12029 TaxID=1314781 RepID=A0A165IHP6_EXIGL|nr:Ctr-domain-containing protein [Exidia glandulosa HHB12029]
MDHSHHHHHDHSAAAAAADALIPGRCSMNMLWNTQIIDTCIVFREWHIRSQTGFLFALVVITGLGVLYEYLRIVQANYDRKVAVKLAVAKGKTVAPPSIHLNSEEAPLLSGSSPSLQSRSLSKVPSTQRITRALLYGSSVFLSFFLMLVFMTYNAYLIGAVVVGAALGHYVFGAEMDADAVLAAGGVAGKGASCH